MTKCRFLAAALSVLWGVDTASAEAAAVLEVSSAEIVKITWQAASANVHLSPDAATRLRSATRRNIGRALEVRIDGVTAVKATVMGEIDSGIVYLGTPSKRVRELLVQRQRALDQERSPQE
jgi:hypothetical protein